MSLKFWKKILITTILPAISKSSTANTELSSIFPGWEDGTSYVGSNGIWCERGSSYTPNREAEENNFKVVRMGVGYLGLGAVATIVLSMGILALVLLVRYKLLFFQLDLKLASPGEQVHIYEPIGRGGPAQPRPA